MPRVEISFPKFTHFSTELPVRIGDVNQGSHLGHDSMVTMLHEARIQFFRSLGYDELDIEGVGTLVADLAISYRNEAFYGDNLKFDIAVEDISRKSCQFIYQVIRSAPVAKTEKREGDRSGVSCDAGSGSTVHNNVKSGETIAVAKTGIVFFDYAVRKSAAIPAGFIEQLEKRSS